MVFGLCLGGFIYLLIRLGGGHRLSLGGTLSASVGDSFLIRAVLSLVLEKWGGYIPLPAWL